MENQLVVIEKGSELVALSTEEGIQSLIERAKDAVNNSDGGSLETKAGRAKIRSNAFQATKLKTSMEKEAIKLIDGIEKGIAPELEKIVNIKKYSKQLGLGLDKVRSDTNAEVKAVEDELQRIEDEKIELANLEALLIKKECDHEMALLIDKTYAYDQEQILLLAEQEEKRIAKEREDYAAEQVKLAGQRQKQAILDSLQRESNAENARLANKEHVQKVKTDIYFVLVNNGISELDAKKVIKLATNNELPQLTINY